MNLLVLSIMILIILISIYYLASLYFSDEMTWILTAISGFFGLILIGLWTRNDTEDNIELLEEMKDQAEDLDISKKRNETLAEAQKFIRDVEDIIPRTYDEIPHRLKYFEDFREDLIKNTAHFGQLKLIDSEIRFLTQIVKENPEKKIFVMYLGAAPSNKHKALMRLFPDINWLLWDPNSFHIRDVENIPPRFQRIGTISKYHYPPQYKKMIAEPSFWDRIMTSPIHQATIFKGYFDFEDLELIEENIMIPQNTVFAYITDIRTNVHGPGDADIVGNHVLQSAVHKILKPNYSMMKFRPAFHDEEATRSEIYDIISMTLNVDIEKKFAENPEKYEDFEKIIDSYFRNKLLYYDGDLHIQAYPGGMSTESRLMTKSDTLVEIDEREYEDKFFYYNVVTRSYALGENPLMDSARGMDRSADAVQFGRTVKEYCDLMGIQSENCNDVVKMILAYARANLADRNLGIGKRY